MANTGGKPLLQSRRAGRPPLAHPNRRASDTFRQEIQRTVGLELNAGFPLDKRDGDYRNILASKQELRLVKESGTISTGEILAVHVLSNQWSPGQKDSPSHNGS
jgi:hypothetical protein